MKSSLWGCRDRSVKLVCHSSTGASTTMTLGKRKSNESNCNQIRVATRYASMLQYAGRTIQPACRERLPHNQVGLPLAGNVGWPARRMLRYRVGPLQDAPTYCWPCVLNSMVTVASLTMSTPSWHLLCTSTLRVTHACGRKHADNNGNAPVLRGELVRHPVNVGGGVLRDEQLQVREIAGLCGVRAAVLAAVAPVKATASSVSSAPTAHGRQAHWSGPRTRECCTPKVGSASASSCT